MPPDPKETIEDLKEMQEAEEAAGTEQVEVEDPEEAEEPQEPTPRQAARRERAGKFKAEQEGRVAAERERDDLRVRLAAAEAARAYAPQHREEPKPDPADQEVERVTKEMQGLQSQYGELVRLAEAAQKAIAPEVVQSFRDKYEALNVKRSETIAERAHRKVAGQAQQNGPTTEQAAAVAALKMRYADVDSHPRGADIGRYASGLWQAHLASGGSNTLESMDRIVDDARRKFGIAKSPPPSAATKARYSGTGAGATAANGTNHAQDVKSFPMNKTQRAMAMEMYPDLPEKKAIQKFIQIQLKRGVKTA